MVFATLEQVKSEAIFKAELQEQLTDPEIQRLIDRARRQLIRTLERDFEDETNADVLFDLSVANIYLVDTLFITSRRDAAHLAIMGVQSEKKSEYQVTFSAHKMQQFNAFSAEYDSIIASLAIAPDSDAVPTVFRVGKRRRRGVDPID